MKTRFESSRGRPPARRQEGVALVITLILLAVITFMAITFLVVSRSEQGAVASDTDQALARLAADAGFERAKVQLVAPLLGFNNQFNYDLAVSTDYHREGGFLSGVSHYTNVNYVYPNGQPLTGNDVFINLTNMWFDGSPPVYMRRPNGTMELRTYLDLNRNQRYDTNGWVPVLDSLGYPTVTVSNGIVYTNYANVVGDPIWIGGLEFPDRHHSSTNRYIYRYAWMAIPMSKTLDINYMHNYARMFRNSPNMQMDGFVRNQGFGTYELNLAGFLADLNYNMWPAPYPFSTPFGTPYVYNTADLTQPNTGAAFDDAVGLLRYRYRQNWMQPQNVWSANMMFGNANAQGLLGDFADAYSTGPIMTNTQPRWTLDPDRNKLNIPWGGGFNTNHFFAMSDLLDKSKTALPPTQPVSFTDRLRMASTNLDSYNSYTYYRLLSQLGTESSPEPPKININYKNVQNGQIIPSMASQFLPWDPTEFFTNTANKLLANAGYTFNVHNIQVYPLNNYTPTVHHLLQQAANLYDATTNKFVSGNRQGPGLPTVFQPQFEVIQTNLNGVTLNAVYIRGYTELTDLRVLPSVTSSNWFDPVAAPPTVAPDAMCLGVPLVVGAKKGYPNFNEFAMQTMLQVTRKLEFRRGSLTGPVNETNQMYTLSVSNTFGLELWNSYSNAFPRNLELQAAVTMTAVITNETGKVLLNTTVQRPAVQIIPATGWRGFTEVRYADRDGSIRVPFPPATNNFYFLGNVTYSDSRQVFDRLTGTFERPKPSTFPYPQWWLKLRARVVYVLIDREQNRIVDFVNLDSSDPPVNLADMLQRDTIDTLGPCDYPYIPNGSDGSMWCTNRQPRSFALTAPTFGILNQIKVGLHEVTSPSWLPGTNQAGIDFFRVQFDRSPEVYPAGTFSKTNIFYCPFSPTRNVYFFKSWQANDPLVHYTIGDLISMERTNLIAFDSKFSTITNIGQINQRYEPWTATVLSGSSSPTRFDLSVKDPRVGRSDDWDFPTNKLPNVGWIGRVHRGTPWQTVYLKSTAAHPVRWMRYAGSGLIITNYGQVDTNIVKLLNVIDDTAMSRPTNDWHIVDMFTAAVHENATRGQLSINQTNIAAWSAVLSGVNVMPDLGSSAFIEPAGTNTAGPLGRLVGAINDVRRTNYAGGAFRRLGDVLSVPELTVHSPFLRDTNNCNDAVYERIPEQVLGLLRCEDTPRFVIYTYGQALKPATHSVMMSGQYSGLCTNYQVTAEVATRSVVRIEDAATKPRVVVESHTQLSPDQ